MNIIVVDDDALVSLSLKTIIESSGDINVLAMGQNGKDAISLYKEHKPDIVLMDIRMGEMSGLDAAKEIISSDSNARILLLTTFSDDEYIIKALQVGAKGYILKQNFESIVPSLYAVFNGQTVFGDEIIDRLPNLLSDNNKENAGMNYKNFDLTDKEYDIIKLVANGLNNREIASELCLGEGTIRNYLSIILEKLELRDRTQLACFYYQNLNA